MSSTIRHFLNLIQVELEDIKDDIKALEDLLRERLNCREITNYVYKENTALLEHEYKAITVLLKNLPSSLEGENGNLEHAAERLKQYINKESRKRQYHDAVPRLVERKIMKVLRYLTQNDQ